MAQHSNKDFHERFSAGEAPVAPPSPRSTGLVFAGVALVVAWLWRTNANVLWGALGTAGMLSGLALAWPRALAPLNQVWFRFGLVLHKIMNPIVMLALYAIAIVPAGLIMQLLRDPLHRKRPQGPTYWIDVKPEDSAGRSMRNQF